jgi:hypothetical protein
MQKMPSMQFFNTITEQEVTILRVLTLAFIMGVVFFSGILVFIYSSNTPPQSAPDSSDLFVPSVINAVLTFTFAILSIIVPRRYLEKTSLIVKDALSMQSAFLRIRSSLIYRVALLEVPALFGLCVCTVAVMNGVFYFSEIYALNAVPALFMILNLVYLFPTKNRISSWYEMIS